MAFGSTAEMLVAQNSPEGFPKDAKVAHVLVGLYSGIQHMTTVQNQHLNMLNHIEQVSDEAKHNRELMTANIGIPTPADQPNWMAIENRLKPQIEEQQRAQERCQQIKDGMDKVVNQITQASNKLRSKAEELLEGTETAPEQLNQFVSQALDIAHSRDKAIYSMKLSEQQIEAKQQEGEQHAHQMVDALLVNVQDPTEKARLSEIITSEFIEFETSAKFAFGDARAAKPEIDSLKERLKDVNEGAEKLAEHLPDLNRYNEHADRALEVQAKELSGKAETAAEAEAPAPSPE